MMHKLSKQLLSLLLSVMLVLSMSSVAFAAEEDEYTSSGGQTYGPYTYTALLSGDIYYGELSPMAKRIYDGLKDAMTNPPDSWLTIEIPLNQVNGNDFTEEALIQAYSALRNEWPELFQWVDLGFSFTLESNNVSWRVSYFLDVQEAYRGTRHVYESPSDFGSTSFEYWEIIPQTVNAQQKAAEAKAALVLANAPAGDDYAKVVYFNNWIIDNTEYDFDGIEPGQPYDNTYHIAGVFLDGKAVCEGYAKALKYLCDKSGIECLYITGNLIVDDAGTPGPHAWNYVKLDGAWYIADPTNNDNPEPYKNLALCIGTSDPFASLLIPDGAYDPDNAVFVPTPGVTLSTDNYGDRAKSITFTAPTKTEYLPGEALDLTGGSILITRHNGVTDSVAMTADMLSGLDLNKAGVQQVTVSYNGIAAANKLTITVKNVPVAASIHEAVVNYAIGVSSLDLSKGYAMVTYADDTVARPRLNDTTKVQVAVAIGVSGLEAGKHTVTVTVLDQNKNFVTTYEIGVGEDNVIPELPDELTPPTPTPGGGGGGSGGGSSSNVPNALPPENAIAQLKTLDPKSPPAGSKSVTVGGKNILTLPMAIPGNGMVDIGTITQLGALPAGVGVVINQGAGKPELLIPGGFKFTAEPGRFALPLLVTNALSAEAKAAVTTALGANRTLVYSGTLGGSTIVKFPTAFTVMVPVKLAEGTSVTVQMVNPITGKVLSTVTAKVVNGVVSFPTTTTGGIVLSTAK